MKWILGILLVLFQLMAVEVQGMTPEDVGFKSKTLDKKKFYTYDSSLLSVYISKYEVHGDFYRLPPPATKIAAMRYYVTQYKAKGWKVDEDVNFNPYICYLKKGNQTVVIIARTYKGLVIIEDIYFNNYKNGYKYLLELEGLRPKES